MPKIGAPLALLLLTACASVQEPIAPTGAVVQARSNVSFVGCVHLANLLYNTTTPVQSVVWRRDDIRETRDCGMGAIPVEESAFTDYEQWAQRSRGAAPTPISRPRA